MMAGTTSRVHGKPQGKQKEVKYLPPVWLLLLPDFIKAPDLSSRAQLLPAACHFSLQIHLLLLSPPPSLQASRKLPSFITTTFDQQKVTSSSSRRLPIALHCLRRLSLRICISQVGPLRLSLSSTLQAFSASRPSSRLSRKSLAQVAEHLQHWVAWLLVLREHRNFFTIHLSTRSSPRPRRTTPLCGLAQTFTVLFWQPEARMFSSWSSLPTMIKSCRWSSMICHLTVPGVFVCFLQLSLSIFLFSSSLSKQPLAFFTLQSKLFVLLTVAFYR